jgi:hypothetical protein
MPSIREFVNIQTVSIGPAVKLIRRPTATSDGDAAMMRSHVETKNYVDSEYRRIFEPFQSLSSSTILSILVLI